MPGQNQCLNTIHALAISTSATTRTHPAYLATRNIGERLSAADRNSGGGWAGSAGVVTATVFSRHTGV